LRAEEFVSGSKNGAGKTCGLKFFVGGEKKGKKWEGGKKIKISSGRYKKNKPPPFVAYRDSAGAG